MPRNSTVRTLWAGLRLLLAFTVVFGIAYPLVITGVAQIPGLKHRAEGSLVTGPGGRVVGSSLVGQGFGDAKGQPLTQYLQPRPSAAGAGYDPTATSASNLGPESVVDTLPDPGVKGDTGKQSLLTQVCARSRAVGALEGVDGSRPFCTADGVGAVLAVFHAGPGYAGPVVRAVSVNQPCPGRPFILSYGGVAVSCATPGQDYAAGQVVPVRGSGPVHPAVPADAVTASGSGLDPGISPAYAALQAPRIARARGVGTAAVRAVIADHTTGRALGFMGEPSVDVLQVNLALDRRYPAGS